MNDGNGTIVVLSGGMDSAVLLAQRVAIGEPVKALSINYGQRHRRELEFAAQLAGYYHVEHQVADLRGLQPLLKGSSQSDPDVAVPKGHYAEESMKLTVVPNRNMLLLATAVAWAISSKFRAVAYAAHAGDHAIYPDCREEFVAHLAKAVELADWHVVALERPFVNWTKADIAAEGDRLKVPFDLTYSCYEGRIVHCGECGTCVERRMAFIAAGVSDPTQYVAGLKQEYQYEAVRDRARREEVPL